MKITSSFLRSLFFRFSGLARKSANFVKRPDMGPKAIAFGLSKAVFLFGVLWFSIWVSRIVCCFTFAPVLEGETISAHERTVRCMANY
jgi:hypothetical protein